MTTCLACSAELGVRGFAANDRLHGTPGSYVVATCRACGSGRTLPAASAEQIASFYPESYSPYEPAARPLERVVSSLIRRWQCFSALRRLPLSTLGTSPKARVLDVGCGRGDLGGYLARNGWEVVGVEPSASAAAAARAQGVEVLTGVMASVALEPESFGAAIFQQSLEHTEAPADDLKRAFAALRPEGVISVSVPNYGGRQARRFHTNWFHLDVPRHRTHFTPTGLRKGLEAAGFTEIQISTSTSPVGLPASVQYRLAGRCLFPDGLRLRVAAGLCSVALPLAMLVDYGTLQGDVLNATARRPGAGTS